MPRKENGLHLSLAAHRTMPTENRSYLEEVERQQFDKLLRELLQTVGAVSAILDCAASAPPESQLRFLLLARESAARGTRTLRKVLWQWVGIRKDSSEENTARSPEAIIKALKTEIRKLRC
jgi:hypothetical protein